MDFEWDEQKRALNVSKHGLDFLDAKTLFSGETLERPARKIVGEDRFLAIGAIGDKYVTVVFTRRREVVRIISMRRARNEERDGHKEVFGG